MPTYKEAFEKLAHRKEGYGPSDKPLTGSMKGMRYNPKQDIYQTEEEFTTAAKAWNVKQGKGKPKVGEEFDKAQKKLEDQQAIYEDLQKEHVRLSQQLKAVKLGKTKAQTAQATKANDRIQTVVDAANAPEDLLTGKDKRKQERRSRRVEKIKGKIEKTKAGTANKARLGQLSSALSSAQERRDK